MVHTLQPIFGDTIYDPCRVSGGFLAIAHGAHRLQSGPGPRQHEYPRIKALHTFFGREKQNFVFPIALANLVLHCIDKPNLWHGNTLTRGATYSGLFEGAPRLLM